PLVDKSRAAAPRGAWLGNRPPGEDRVALSRLLNGGRTRHMSSLSLPQGPRFHPTNQPPRPRLGAGQSPRQAAKPARPPSSEVSRKLEAILSSGEFTPEEIAALTELLIRLSDDEAERSEQSEPGEHADPPDPAPQVKAIPALDRVSEG